MYVPYSCMYIALAQEPKQSPSCILQGPGKMNGGRKHRYPRPSVMWHLMGAYYVTEYLYLLAINASGWPRAMPRHAVPDKILAVPCHSPMPWRAVPGRNLCRAGSWPSRRFVCLFVCFPLSFFIFLCFFLLYLRVRHPGCQAHKTVHMNVGICFVQVSDS